MRLGKHPKKADARNLQFARYCVALPEIPGAGDWTQGRTDWGMMANDTVGDCTCAAVAHLLQVQTLNAGDLVTVPDRAVLDLYALVSGYKGTTATDTGAVLLDVLKASQKAGIGGHQLGAFAEVDPPDHRHMAAAVHLFGGLVFGVQFPQAWADAPPVWAIPTGSGARIIGGHAIMSPKWADADGLTLISWGRLYLMPWAAVDEFCDEAYAVIDPDWVVPGGISPSAFDFEALQADLVLVKG